MTEDIQNELDKQKPLVDYEANEIEYAMKPIGKAIYLHQKKKKKSTEPKHWTDRVVCKDCGKEFARSHKTNHNKTQYHKMHVKFHEKFRKIMLGE